MFSVFILVAICLEGLTAAGAGLRHAVEYLGVSGQQVIVRCTEVVYGWVPASLLLQNAMDIVHQEILCWERL